MPSHANVQLYDTKKWADLQTDHPKDTRLLGRMTCTDVGSKVLRDPGFCSNFHPDVNSHLYNTCTYECLDPFKGPSTGNHTALGMIPSDVHLQGELRDTERCKKRIWPTLPHPTPPHGAVPRGVVPPHPYHQIVSPVISIPQPQVGPLLT